jgi:hypothetical protein
VFLSNALRKLTHPLLLGLAVVACGRQRDVAVRVSIPGPDSMETPVTGVGLVALPYDRDSVLKSLEAAAHSSRPHVAALDSLFRDFRGPFNTYSAATFRVGKLRDSVAEMKAALDSLPRNAPEYATAYARFGRLSDSLKVAQAAAETARGALDRARAGFVARSESLRAEVRSWEDSTYRGYDSIVHNLALRQHREPVTDTTRSDGWARLRLEPGRWWIYARSWDATDPNAEWYWNVPLTGDTLLLSSRTGRRQPRY